LVTASNLPAASVSSSNRFQLKDDTQVKHKLDLLNEFVPVILLMNAGLSHAKLNFSVPHERLLRRFLTSITRCFYRSLGGGLVRLP
jgi:hypothetical protein